MTIQQIYDLAIQMGTNADPRGKSLVDKLLKERNKAFKELPEKKKKYFDPETLTNPYSDTRLFTADASREVKRVMAGIDTDAAEVLIADRLNERGKAIDAVIGHHPAGHAFASLHDVMDLQVDTYANEGVPVNVIDSLMRERQELVKRKIHPSNHNQVIDAARLLDIPLMVLHTVWDNLGDNFMKQYIAKKKDYHTVEDVMDHLMELPEYQEAAKGKNAPEIVSGSPKSRAGRIAIFFTGGTNPSKEVYAELAKTGVGTLIDMHIPEDGLAEAKKARMNVINAGHMASDSIGANIFFDELEKKGVEIIPCSGFIRVKRTAK